MNAFIGIVVAIVLGVILIIAVIGPLFFPPRHQ